MDLISYGTGDFHGPLNFSVIKLFSSMRFISSVLVVVVVVVVINLFTSTNIMRISWLIHRSSPIEPTVSPYATECNALANHSATDILT